MQDSPAGCLQEPCVVPFRTVDEQELVVAAGTPLDEAVRVGRRLGQALLPPPVFELLRQSLKIAAREETTGLRLRLVLDDFLADLAPDPTTCYVVAVLRYRGRTGVLPARGHGLAARPSGDRGLVSARRE